MRKLKWILGILFTLVVALLVAAYAVVSNYDVAKLKTLIQDQVKAATGRDLEIRGDLATRFSLTPSIMLGDVRLANAPWATTPDMVTMQRLEVEVELLPLLSGDVEIARMVMVQPTIELERNAQGEGNWVFSGAANPGDSTLSFHAVQIDQGSVAFHDEKTGLRRSLRIESLTADGAGKTAPLDVKATGTLENEPFDITASLGDLNALLQGQETTIKLDGRVARATVALSGTAAPLADQGGGTLDLSLQGEDLAALSTLAGGPLPVGPFKLSTQIEQQGTLYRFNGLTASIGASDLAGNLQVELGGALPQVSGALVSKRLALAELRTGVTDKGQATSTSGLIPADELPVAFLKNANGRLTLSVGDLVLDKTVAKDLQATATLTDGKLVLDPLSFSYGGGPVSGRVEIDSTAQPPTTVIKLAGTGIDSGQLSGGNLSGTMSLSLDVSGHGESPKAIAASLNGRTEMASQGGTLNNQVLAAASTGLMELFMPLLGVDKEAKITCVVNRMQWKDGIGTSQGTAMETDSFTVVGNGTVNLRNETLDFYLDTSTSDASLVSLAVPVRAQGSLSAPSITPDPAGTALGLAKAAGLVVFPPAGLAAIIGDKAKSGSGNPCLAAIQEVSDKGGPMQFFQNIGDATKGAIDDTGKAIGRGADDAWKGLQNLLGN